MASILEFKLKFRDAVNNLTGRKKLIAQYSQLVDELSRMSDQAPAESDAKKYLMSELNSIIEAQYNVYHNNMYYDAYNPYCGPKQILQNNIKQLSNLHQVVTSQKRVKR